MTKKWIIETIEENCVMLRAPNPGEYYLGLQGMTAYKAPEYPPISNPCVILHPISDDVVMVPRERIEALRESMKVDADGLWSPARFEAASSAILACAEPAKPMPSVEDPIPEGSELETTLKNWKRGGFVNCRDQWNAVTDALRAALLRVTALREKELKERGE